MATICSDMEKSSLNQACSIRCVIYWQWIFTRGGKKFSIMEIPYMSNSTFASCERTTGKIIQGCAQETMCAAIEEEKRQAELRNDKDNDGYHCITVIVDGVPKKDSLEAVTRGQSSSERWRHERSRRISSSFFKDVADRRPTTLSAALVKRIIYNDNVSTKALKYGLANEAVALNQYKEKHMGKNIRRCGLFIDPKYPFLCTSPDGLIDEDGLLEIKCPYTWPDSQQTCQTFSASLILHKYYFQIQGQLAITERNWCDLYIWCREDAITLRIPEDKTFWISLVPKLEKFYVNCILPELVDPRAPRKMSLREPKYIVDARAQNEKQKQATASVKQTQEKREIEISEADKIISSPRKNAGEKRIRKPKIIFDL
ncbi:uncharacterized protein LOC118202607 [Stegodyphus dumicola]|uniref:uncharacterized protein LOC118202607 n=1 Tax=Stegodyphus dumicola TaxID=202533 RepID=UPI0015ABADF5|nr:uncharacterized protein LOC118202607 [Stegodyphus dumicola]